MRILIANRYRERVGGVESYLHATIPRLAAAGHALAFFCEREGDPQRPMIELPPGAPVWCAEQPGAVAAAQAWRADVIYNHGLENVALEARLLALAPVVFFAHDYYGLCISGSKSFAFPTTQVCDRRFGAACLAEYYPRRCGGLNPLTMVRLYARAAERLKLLRRCKLVLTASECMRREYVRAELPPDRVISVRYPIMRQSSSAAAASTIGVCDPLCILFAGRMVTLKGGEILIDALPLVSKLTQRNLRMIFMGDGPARNQWERAASGLTQRESAITVEFPGWLTGPAYEAVIGEAHLLAMPSLWPEPFGRIGLEAGLFGLPTVAFAVGGIPEWLREGVNGHLAAADPPTAQGLAAAVLRAIVDPQHYAALRAGASAQATAYPVDSHVALLNDLFHSVAG